MTTAPDMSKPRRILSVYLPRFGMEHWEIRARRRGETLDSEKPCALGLDTPRGPVVHAVNPAAEAQGIHAGARVVDMRALCPDLRMEHADLHAEKHALERLMLWSRRWAPWSAIDGKGGLVLDVTGCAHLFGGEDGFLRKVEADLARAGMTCRLAIAPTHGAAWALARYGTGAAICHDVMDGQLAALSVRALRIAGETVTLLNRLGLKTIGDLLATPRVPLTRRFARNALEENPLMRLDQMTGKLAEPLTAPKDPPRFVVQSRLAEPVQDPTEWIPQLAEELCTHLHDEGKGLRRVHLTVYRTDGEVSSVTCATSQATRDPKHIARLFDGKLESIDPGFGFDLITLIGSANEQIGTRQTRLDRKPDHSEATARTIDRLIARFGPPAVLRPKHTPRHMPERQEHWQTALASDAYPTPINLQRPCRLLEHPEEIRVLYAVPEGPPAQFSWRKLVHRINRYEGPERIAPEWWNDRASSRIRDYYRIEEQYGLRLWIYRNGLLNDGRGFDPLWFMHGLFL
ncbi:Y-family DNA polymerase [Marivivens donghaensis]|nr:DNA polymerase Y family protein [Marivivens donghaensis]